ncbi:uncharacterized protein LOC123194401 [Mangifera indica]|uniref:uncharacterized protein LOC123194401 n=1 Tax=Mangifera indica TaxID=29780 RepID=UPI001CFB3B72|nr:uncharacterized protein LOC123194401 [Mangifera indica]
MGSCFSTSRKSPSSSSPTKFSNVRVVHLNGWVEDFDFPVSVSQLTGSPPKHFVFTAAQLLSSALKPLKPDTLLERGRLYFLVPSSTFQTDVSPADLVSVVKRLTAKAKSCKAEVNDKSPGSGNTSPSSWSQYSSRVSPVVETYGFKYCSRKEPWRPILDTIREMSFDRRSESDLRERSFTQISESDLLERHYGDQDKHQI